MVGMLAYPAFSRLPATLGISLFALAASAVDPGPSAAATCPAAFVRMTRLLAAPFTTNAVTYDSSFVDVFGAHITFDRTLGTLSLEAGSGGRLAVAVRVVEALDVTGVAPGTPVSGVLELVLEGYSQQNCGGAGCGVQLEGTLVAQADSVVADANQIGPAAWTRPLATTLALPLAFVAGSPVRAEFALVYGTGPGQTDAAGHLSGRYRVRGLPDGVHAVACAGGDVTPVRGATWGALKSRYR